MLNCPDWLSKLALVVAKHSLRGRAIQILAPVSRIDHLVIRQYQSIHLGRAVHRDRIQVATPIAPSAGRINWQISTFVIGQFCCLSGICTGGLSPRLLITCQRNAPDCRIKLEFTWASPAESQAEVMQEPLSTTPPRCHNKVASHSS